MPTFTPGEYEADAWIDHDGVVMITEFKRILHSTINGLAYEHS